MGNICITYINDDYYEFKNKKKIYKKCYKCKDKFCVDKGGFSKRRSCRQHTIENNHCTDCNLHKTTIQSCNITTCYHVIAPKKNSRCIIC